MPLLPPEQLVRLVQQTIPGDHRAFEQLVTQYKGFVFATALRLMGNREDAEDQTQDVFLKVYDEIKKLEVPATFTAWLSRVTVNTCLNALKRQRRLRLDSLDQLVWIDNAIAIDGITALPETVVLTRELRTCIEQALAELSDAERVILVLRDVEDCSYQEISDLLKVGLSAVKMRIYRTRLAFQGVFRRVCPGLWQANTVGSHQ